MADMFFENINEEVRGHIYPGKLRLKPSDVMFKNEANGKVQHFASSDIDSALWISRVSGMCLRLKLNNENVHRFEGFGEIESEKVTSFFKKNYGVEITKRELCYKGYNWGDVEFHGNVMEFTYKNTMSFDIPLSNISNAAANKNEFIFEFHPNDDAEICLSEMRFHTPGTEADKDGAAAAIHARVMQKADIIQVTGDSVVEFKDIAYLQPRGRYDVKLYNTFMHLHGKSFDYKIPKSTIIRLLLLPHPDGRQVFFAAQVDPPLKHGQTRYHIIIMVFDKEKHVDIELSVSEEYLQKNYEGKLTQVMAGPEYELFARICKALYNQKLTVPGSFKAKNGGSAVACSYKASVGLIYPLEKGLIFVPRPPVSIRFDEIVSVNFSRGTGSLRSFDFDVETRNGVTHTFVSIERDEYHKLYDYVTEKRLRVKNIEDKDAVGREKLADVWSSSDESHDAYLDKVKAEGRERIAEASAGTFAGADFSDDDEDDEDFAPPDMNSSDSDIAEEYDSNAQSSSSSGGGGGGRHAAGRSGGTDSESQSGSNSSASPKPKKQAKKSKPPGSSHKKRESKKNSSKKDPNAPSRPPTAYFLWFNEKRAEIKASLGGATNVTVVAKAGGERWKALDADEKAKYAAEVEKLKRRYDEEMKVYKAKIESGEIEAPQSTSVTKKPKSSAPSSSKSHKKPVVAASTSSQGGSNFKSAEYVLESESSSEGGDGSGGAEGDSDLSD